MGQDIGDSLIDFFALDQIDLKSSVHFTFDWTDRECEEIGIVLKTLLQSRVIACVSVQLITTSDFESARQTHHNVAISLTVKFNLARLVPHQLCLVSTFDGAQFVRAPAR